MNKKNAFIFGLNYSPGLAKEYTLLGRKLIEKGWDVKFVLAKEYNWLVNDEDLDVVYITKSKNLFDILIESLLFPRFLYKIWRLFQNNTPQFICIYNFFPLNAFILVLCKFFYNDCIRAIYLHEPYKPDKSGYTAVGAIYRSLIDIVTSFSVKVSNYIILPSTYARELFDKGYPQYRGKVKVVPILLEDPYYVDNQRRKFISLVGTINTHGGRDVNQFFSFINYAVERKMGINFKIVTRSDIQRDLKHLTKKARLRTEIINKPSISDKEIAQTMNESIALFLPHRQVTQSGNVPVAFRCGTPIIARNLPGFSQHIVHKKNGYLISPGVSNEKIEEAINCIKSNFESMSSEARKSFMKIFSEDNWEDYYDWLD